MTQECPDCGKEYKSVEQHIKMSDCGNGEESKGIEMSSHCDQCETALRRRERLTEHPNVDRAVLFEAYVECDCSEHVLGATSVSITEVPDGWSR
jgi:hypothetical protein